MILSERSAKGKIIGRSRRNTVSGSSLRFHENLSRLMKVCSEAWNTSRSKSNCTMRGQCKTKKTARAVQIHSSDDLHLNQSCIVVNGVSLKVLM